MGDSIVDRLASYPDLSFIPACVSAFLSAQYTLAKHPAIATQGLTFITSLFRHCNRTRPTTTLELWQIPHLAMAPICLMLATSVSAITRLVEVDRIYSSLMLIALSATLSLGYALDLPADMVVFGLLPFFLVSALLLTRLGQQFGGTRRHEMGGQVPLDEKA